MYRPRRLPNIERMASTGASLTLKAVSVFPIPNSIASFFAPGSHRTHMTSPELLCQRDASGAEAWGQAGSLYTELGILALPNSGGFRLYAERIAAPEAFPVFLPTQPAQASQERGLSANANHRAQYVLHHSGFARPRRCAAGAARPQARVRGFALAATSGTCRINQASGTASLADTLIVVMAKSG